MKTQEDVIDAVVVGGGPAGLNAALALGRALKTVLLCDGGTPRNAAAEHVHTFVTRDGVPPREFRRIAREELARYETVKTRDALVTAIEPIASKTPRFAVTIDGQRVEARRVVLTTGMVDVMPEIPGFRELWGTGIAQCPYCHGYEVREQPLAVLAVDAMTFEWSSFLKGWSKDVVVLTNGAFPVSAESKAKVEAMGVRVDERRIARLVGASGRLTSIAFADGDVLARSMLFTKPAQTQTPLVRALGLALGERGEVRVSELGETSVPGIFAGGDLTTQAQGAVMAAAQGAMAAMMMNHGLTMELLAEGRL